MAEATVRLPDNLFAKAREQAQHENLTITEYLSDLLLDAITEDLADAACHSTRWSEQDAWYDGAVNTDGAVWRDSCWHLVRIAEDGRNYSAVCSCGWLGPERVPGHPLVPARSLAFTDGDRHAWSVDI
jgi:hypothetical protein